MHAGIPPPPSRPHLTRHHPPRPDTTPLDQTPPPQTRHHHSPGPDPPRGADASIRSMSGRYASYWNAFLFLKLSGVGAYILGGSLGFTNEQNIEFSTNPFENDITFAFTFLHCRWTSTGVIPRPI